MSPCPFASLVGSGSRGSPSESGFARSRLFGSEFSLSGFFSGVFAIERYAKIAAEAKTWKYKKAFMLIGLLNGINGVLIIFSNPHVPGVTQSVLSQAVIPLTLGLSVLILRMRVRQAGWAWSVEGGSGGEAGGGDASG